MTKSIEDYRNIVKILKLQLLKIRQQNASLSHQMGIISESQTSSYTPKLNRYKQSNDPFALKVVLFLQFAHRCELVGITPQMVFRIADKKRDQTVNANNLGEVMKRIKIKMSEEQINKFLGALKKNNTSIQYNEYLQILSAFHINAQKYPTDSVRTFVQICLISFAKKCKVSFSSAKKLFDKISRNQDSFNFDKFVIFCQNQCKQMKQTQIVAVFLGLDIQSTCQVQRDIFIREIDRVYTLIEKGVSDQKIPRTNNKTTNNNKLKKQKYSDNQDIGFNQDVDTGVQNVNKGGTKKQVKKKQPELKQPQLDINKAAIANIQGELKKRGISCADLIQRLLDNQSKRKDTYIRSFSLGDVHEALTSLSQFKKKQSIAVFKLLDKNQNGSTGTDQLLKILIRTDYGKLSKDPSYIFALLYRHLKQIQITNPTLRFTSLGYKLNQKVTQESLSKAFEKLQLSKDQLKYIYPILVRDINLNFQQFSQQLKKQRKKGKPLKNFQKMDPNEYKMLKEIVQKTQKNKKDRKPKLYKKLIRLSQDEQKQANENWQTIFQDQWDCFQYCLQTASKLESFWRDPQFGPSKSDPNGIRSIIGNESQRPPGIPDDQDIVWLTYQDVLKKRKVENANVKLMNHDLKSTDVVQGTLGDCWYVSALSIITLDDTQIKGKNIKEAMKNPGQLLTGIHPLLFQFFAKYGLYVFKFFKGFKPKYVVVDDLFPVEASTNDLIFARSPDPTLQWVSFAQKAYAKLHHTYSNMISGDIAQGLNDLSNYLPIKQNLVADTDQDIDLNRQKISELIRQKHLMGCSIKMPKTQSSLKQPPVTFDDQKCGLVAGHAYSIIDFLQLRKNNQFKLMRIRNPWGHGEWLLRWSDTPLNDDPSYGQLKQNLKDIQAYYQKKKKQDRELQLLPYRPGEDGQFLMNFQDWNKIFTNLFVGFNDLNRNFKYKYYIEEKWNSKSDKPSGLCKTKNQKPEQEIKFVNNNYQYILQVNQQSQILMLLIQQDGRLFRGQKYPYKQTVNAAIILVFDIGNQNRLKKFNMKALKQPSSLSLQVRRDVGLWCKLPKGRYAVFPCKKQNNIQQSQFQFRIYSNKDIKITSQSNKFKPIQKNYYSSLSEWKQKQAKPLLEYLQKNNPKFS